LRNSSTCLDGSKSACGARKIRSVGWLILGGFLCLLFGACRSTPTQAIVVPTIEFTKVPPSDPGGPETIDTIEGRVIGAKPGQRIVLFAKSEIWWVQPTELSPYTEIQPDSTWKSSTHLGTEYAAVLVDPEYVPQARSQTLPQKGGPIAGVASVEGGPAPPAVRRTISFSGYEWNVRAASSSRGSDNYYDPDNAWTDATGALHLRITRKSGKWMCAEINLARSLGYGTYRFIVRDVSSLEPAAVFGMFTFANESQNREMDIEVSRWGDPAKKNAQYVVQPFFIAANVERFVAPGGVLTFSFRWQPGNVVFSTLRGHEERSPGSDESSGLVSQHVFTSGVPSPGGESVHLDLYVYGNSNFPLQKDAEVVIEKFQYLP
jgi:hypothetical protein